MPLLSQLSWKKTQFIYENVKNLPNHVVGLCFHNETKPWKTFHCARAQQSTLFVPKLKPKRRLSQSNSRDQSSSKVWQMFGLLALQQQNYQRLAYVQNWAEQRDQVFSQSLHSCSGSILGGDQPRDGLQIGSSWNCCSTGLYYNSKLEWNWREKLGSDLIRCPNWISRAF